LLALGFFVWHVVENSGENGWITVRVKNKSGEDLTDIRTTASTWGGRYVLPLLKRGEAARIKFYVGSGACSVRLLYRDVKGVQHLQECYYVESGAFLPMTIQPNFKIDDNMNVCADWAPEEISSAKTADLIRRLHSDDLSVVRAALVAQPVCPSLTEHEVPILEKVVRVGGAGEEISKERAIDCLGWMRGRARKAVPFLLEEMKDDSLRSSIVPALELIDTPKAKQAVEAHWKSVERRASPPL
jgi:hypothetical protein